MDSSFLLGSVGAKIVPIGHVVVSDALSGGGEKCNLAVYQICFGDVGDAG